MMKEEIKKYLMDNYDCDDVSVGDTRLIAQSENIAFLIIEHDINKWILRIAPRASFDIWSNSAVIEMYFNNDAALLNYLENNQLDIYKTLFFDLSDDYKSLLDDRRDYDINLHEPISKSDDDSIKLFLMLGNKLKIDSDYNVYFGSKWVANARPKKNKT